MYLIFGLLGLEKMGFLKILYWYWDLRFFAESYFFFQDQYT